MAKRGEAVHVATTTRRYKGRVYRTHLLRRTFREAGQVKHETLGNISHLPESLVDIIRRSLKGESFVCAQEAFECVRSLPCGHVAATLGTLRKLGLESLLASKRCRERDLVVAMVVARVLEPRSKLATARCLDKETASSVLASALGIDSADEDELYHAMDWLLSRQPRIEQKLARRHLVGHTLVLYDLTSTYFEGRTCSLARIGYSRDGKKNKLQIVFGLLCSAQGCPVAIEVFEGNTGDPNTLAAQVSKLRERFGLERVVLVGDRGMITEARIRQELRPVDGLGWITALRAPAIKKLAANGRVEASLFDERDLAEITSPDYPGERLIVCRNPFLAAERARKREELLEATEKELLAIASATSRAKRPLRGAAQIGLRVGRVINRYKMAKHFRITITDRTLTFERRQDRIELEASLDGVYIVRTNVPRSDLSSDQAVLRYKQLSKVERAFRSFKTVDLRVRPIYHRLASRVRAHIFICMLAYYVEWHMRQLLAPVLFDDETPEIAEQLRSSPVAPAQRSPAATAKANTKRAADGGPVHSFRTLLADLATIVKNQMRPFGSDSQLFELVTTPTEAQRRVFDLLGVPHRV